jgi:hypothetical protein
MGCSGRLPAPQPPRFTARWPLNRADSGVAHCHASACGVDNNLSENPVGDTAVRFQAAKHIQQGSSRRAEPLRTPVAGAAGAAAAQKPPWALKVAPVPVRARRRRGGRRAPAKCGAAGYELLSFTLAGAALYRPLELDYALP